MVDIGGNLQKIGLLKKNELSLSILISIKRLTDRLGCRTLKARKPGVTRRRGETEAETAVYCGLLKEKSIEGNGETIMESKPTHEQAQLQLQVYDQRREAKLRQARDWFGKNYIVNSIDDAMRIAPMGSETGAYVGMVIGYWEQACALLNYGLLHEDLFFETSGEFFGVWEALKPIVPAFRERFANKQILAHLEQAAKRYEAWSDRRNPGHIAAMRQFMQQMRAQTASAAKA